MNRQTPATLFGVSRCTLALGCVALAFLLSPSRRALGQNPPQTMLTEPGKPRMETRRVRCTVILQTRSDRLYCYATNEPFRVLLREPARFANGEVFEAEGQMVTTNMNENLPTLADATVQRLGETNLPPPINVTAAQLAAGLLTFHRVALSGQVLSHEWMAFRGRHLEVVVAQSAGRTFRVNLFEYSKARERLPVGTEAEFVGLSFLETFVEARGPEVQVDMKNLDDCRILRPAPWLTLEVARRLVLAGAVLVVVGGLWLVRERHQIGRLRAAERTVRQLNSDLERRIDERTAELRESESRYRAVIAHAPEGIAVFDAEASRYTEVNQNALDIFGLTREQFLAKPVPVLAIDAPFDSVGQAAGIQEKIAEVTAGRIVEFEWIHRGPTGRQIPLAVRIAPLPISKGRLFIVVVTDITDRKRVEAEMMQSCAREKELNELKSRFVSMVSHEFRTPLGIIMSSAEILQDYVDRLSPVRRGEHLRDIAQCAKHMGGMMEDVLLLSRVEAGRLQCKPLLLDLAEFCQRMVDEVRSTTHQRCPIILSGPARWPESRADESLLRHIFINLLNNAVKYSPAASPVEFIIEVDDHRALFTVRDRGIGIPEADARQLFQAFYRGGNVGEAPGTGLGLIIVKHCVELHGGKIAFESTEGAGTTFIVALPLFGSPVTDRVDTTLFLPTAGSRQNITLVP